MTNDERLFRAEHACNDPVVVLQFGTMSHTITVRLPQDLAEWLQETSERTGIPQGRIIREQLERARAQAERRYMRLAGSVEGPPDLSSRKGFSRS